MTHKSKQLSPSCYRILYQLGKDHTNRYCLVDMTKDEYFASLILSDTGSIPGRWSNQRFVCIREMSTVSVHDSSVEVTFQKFYGNIQLYGFT